MTYFHQRTPFPQSAPRSPAAPAPDELARAREILQRILFENILPFWHPRVIDSEYGGYRLNHDSHGSWKGPAGKSLVSQSRTLWFFSRLARSEYGEDKYREAAAHGYRFLAGKLWDKKSEGFYWETDPAGEKATKTHKLLYGQAFALYALSEYGNACGDESAIALAGALFSILQRRAHDAASGGYREFFLETWTPASPDMIDYLGMTHSVKSMNTHLHLMEAISNYLRVTGNPDARERLIELIFILSSAVLRKAVGACTDAHMHDWSPCRSQGDMNLPDWSPLRGPELSRVSYGHNIENVWLLIEACNALGISNAPFLDLYHTIFDYSLRHGFDGKRGGFYRSGHINFPADRREKIWWIQAECLLGALMLYRLSPRPVYWACFSKTLDWINNYQVDWVHGEWHAQIDKRGTPAGDKAGEWKCAYHNGRAVLQCLEILESIPEDRSQPAS
ncbi:MAG: AGE family epimerase/isomerase [Nitrospirota bacterium]|nr:AGE family epimerase/isomerase [Nitrospirota bacterium]